MAHPHHKKDESPERRSAAAAAAEEADEDMDTNEMRRIFEDVDISPAIPYRTHHLHSFTGQPTGFIVEDVPYVPTPPDSPPLYSYVTGRLDEPGEEDRRNRARLAYMRREREEDEEAFRREEAAQLAHEREYPYMKPGLSVGEKWRLYFESPAFAELSPEEQEVTRLEVMQAGEMLPNIPFSHKSDNLTFSPTQSDREYVEQYVGTHYSDVYDHLTEADWERLVALRAEKRAAKSRGKREHR